MLNQDWEHEFRKYYGDRADEWRGHLSYMTSLVQITLRHAGLEVVSVSGRIKSFESCLAKFHRKYRQIAEEDTRQRRPQEYLTDILGLRVVCYYDDDIGKVVDVVKKNFGCHGETNKAAQLQSEQDVFGYRAHHLDISIGDVRKGLPEYSELGQQRAELQIRTALQDAWSTVQHRIEYKRQIPPELSRQIKALAAQIELADNTFVQIRDLTQQLRDAAAAAADTLDEGAFASQLNDILGVSDVTGEAVTRLVLDLEQLGEYDLAEVLTAVREYRAAVTAFLSSTGQEDMRPVTIVRNCLYLADRERYRTLLYSSNRMRIDAWLATRAGADSSSGIARS